MVFNRSILNDVNMRVFEAVACGSLLVTNDLAQNGLDELLRDGEHLVTYRDDDELIERVRCYLDNPDEREAIAERGMEEALARHTYRHRMERVLDATDGPRPSRRPTSSAYYQFARPDILRLVPENSERILDVGCGAGRMGEALKARQKCSVVGLETDPQPAREARQWIDEVFVADAEKPVTDLKGRSFDCIVLGDVLEHFRDPEQTLSRLVSHLEPDGTVVASIPNVRNTSVLQGLGSGFWSYEPAGILDRDHARFFALGDMLHLFASAGLEVTTVHPVFQPDVSQWRAAGRSPSLQIGRVGLTLPDSADAEELFVYQYIIAARPRPQPTHGLVSIVVLAWNELEYTRQCIESVLRHTTGPFELILVDNGSTDGTPEYLATVPDAKVIRNEENLGFPKGVNQGIAAASGEYVCLLNNDTIVTSGWLDKLVDCAESADDVALVGPECNYVASDQLVSVPYVQSTQIDAYAAKHAWRNRGKVAETERLIGFCLLIKRDKLDEVGGGSSTSGSASACSRTTICLLRCARPAIACSSRGTASSTISAVAPSRARRSMLNRFWRRTSRVSMRSWVWATPRTRPAAPMGRSSRCA